MIHERFKVSRRRRSIMLSSNESLLFLVSILLLVYPKPSAQGGFTDKVFGGFVSIGQSMGNATKSVVSTFREWGDRVSPPKKTTLKGESIEPLVSRLCGHPLVERKLMLDCLEKEERHLLHSSWNACLGRAGEEIQNIRELAHWLCHQLKFAENIEGLTGIQNCLFKEVDLTYAMTLYRICAKKLP